MNLRLQQTLLAVDSLVVGQQLTMISGLESAPDLSIGLTVHLLIGVPSELAVVPHAFTLPARGPSTET